MNICPKTRDLPSICTKVLFCYLRNAVTIVSALILGPETLIQLGPWFMEIPATLYKSMS